MTCDAFRSKRKIFYWIRYRRYRVGDISKHSHFFNMTQPLLFSLVFNNWFNITPSLTFNFNLYFSSIWIKTLYTMYLQGLPYLQRHDGHQIYPALRLHDLYSFTDITTTLRKRTNQDIPDETAALCTEPYPHPRQRTQHHSVSTGQT